MLLTVQGGLAHWIPPDCVHTYIIRSCCVGALIPGADKYAATFTYVSKAFGGRPQIGKSDAHSPPSSPPPQRKKHKGSDGGASGNISDDDFVASK